MITGCQDSQVIIPKVEIILKSIISNHSKWELAQDRGLSLCRSIEAKKSKHLQNNEGDPYPNEMESFTTKLKRVYDIFSDILSDTEESFRNLKALEKLNKCSDFILFGFSKMENLVTYSNSIKERYSAEVKLKQQIIGKYRTIKIEH